MNRPIKLPYHIVNSIAINFVNDAVYIILTELLFNAIAIARLEIGME